MDANFTHFDLLNPILSDSYKYSHWKQYPQGTEIISSYIESRGGRWNRTVFFGLQMFLKRYLSIPVNMNFINQAEVLCRLHGEPFYREGWEYIVKQYGGYLPLKIQAVPEGTVVPTGNVLVQVINTDPKCFWLTSFVETVLLQSIWYPTAVATNSYMCKQSILDNLRLTADNPEAEIPFKLHDFGFRGVSSRESAALGGCAHLVNFMGTDTVAGLIYANNFYHEQMAGYSIPASEHSTITSWGGEENEIDAFTNMIEQFGGEGKLYACVSDSYNIWNAAEKWKSLEPLILEKGGTLVIRPDSGNPVAVVSGLADKLMSLFGYEVNSKGYKVLPNHIRIIQGDGVDEFSIKDILNELKFRGISGSNVAFGMGGALLQHLDRDTLRFAYKASAACVNGEWRNVSKDPITDPGKKSKAGILKLVNDKGYWLTVKEEDDGRKNEMEVVWENGRLLVDHKFSDIRARVQ